MLSDEEKKAIDIIKNEIKAFETVITAMEKEIEKNRELEKRVEFLSQISGLLSSDTIIQDLKEE